MPLFGFLGGNSQNKEALETRYIAKILTPPPSSVIDLVKFYNKKFSNVCILAFRCIIIN